MSSKAYVVGQPSPGIHPMPVHTQHSMPTRETIRFLPSRATVMYGNLEEPICHRSPALTDGMIVFT